MAKLLKFVVFTLLVVAVLPGCVMTRDSAANMAATAASEAAATTAATMQLPPTGTPRPTSTPRPSATPDWVATGVHEAVAATVAAREDEATVEPPSSTVTISTLTPSPEGETVAQDPSPTAPAAGEENLDTGASPVFTRTHQIVLAEHYSDPVVLSGWPPIELHPNGDWFTENTAQDSWEAVSQTWKRASAECSMPGGCNVLGPSGVLGADDLAEAEANPSAVWTGSGWHDSPDNSESEFSLLCPEGSYCSVYALQFGLVEIGPVGNPYITLSIPSCGPMCGQGLLIRNWLARPGVDLNTTVQVFNYGEPGAAMATEYTVDPEWAEYFSEGYLTAQAKNAHIRNNNGSGPEDNTMFIQHVLDLNDGSYTVLGHTAEQGWFLLWTNVQSYGTN